ncbi:MAG: selenocysteine-specific translation elongation factor [Bacteroidetes bacterium]|nr:MAG: selenocysteine-specific translation elongation factor [Bacteroidota bacterium]
MKHLILGTAGHVDHGKTAMIKALTDIDCDTHKEEKERGITINLGFSHLKLPSGESLGIVDVPGHKDFIKTMVAGAFGIDIVLLTVAADSGIMPQTSEHLKIIEMLGVKHGIVVLTKVDLVDEEMLELAQMEIAEFLEGTIFEDAPVIGVSSVTGKGMEDLVTKIAEIIPNIEKRKSTDYFRMYIDRIFNVKGIGFVVTGTVLEGEIETGKDVFLLPGKNKKIKIRNIQRHGEQVTNVFCGDRAALNLAGLKLEDYERGMVLSDKQFEETSLIDATISMFDINYEMKLWSKVIFYSGTFECAARIHLMDKDTLKPGETAIAQIHLEKPAILVNKDKFIIRNSSNDITIGGGVIIDTLPLHHRKRTAKLIENLKDLADAILNSDKLFNLIKIELKKEKSPLFTDQLAKKLSLTEEVIIEECQKNNTGSIHVCLSANKQIMLSHEAHKDYYGKVIETIELWHEKNPILEEGLATKEFYGKFDFAKNEAGKLYLEVLMGQILNEGLLRKLGDTYAIADHVVKIDPKTKEQLIWLERTIENVGLDVPDNKKIEDLALYEKIKKDKLTMMLKYLARQKKLVFHQGDYIHMAIVDKSRKILFETLKDRDRGMNEKEIRLLLDSTKKFVKLIIGIFVEEGIVYQQTFYVMMTDKGKGLI